MGTEQIVVDTEQIVVDKVRLRFEAGTWVVDPSGKAQGFLALDKVSVLMDMARCHCMASAFVEASQHEFDSWSAQRQVHVQLDKGGETPQPGESAMWWRQALKIVSD